MSQDQNIKNAADIALGAGGITSIAWIPILNGMDSVATHIAVFGGAFIIIVRVYFTLISWKRYRKTGKIPPLSGE